MRVVMTWEREDTRHMARHQCRETCDWSVSLILSADWLMETGMMQYMMKMKYIIIFIIISIIITGMMQYMMKMMKMKYQPNQNGSSIR